jgi:hypothetical protein
MYPKSSRHYHPLAEDDEEQHTSHLTPRAFKSLGDISGLFYSVLLSPPQFWSLSPSSLHIENIICPGNPAGALPSPLGSVVVRLILYHLPVANTRVLRFLASLGILPLGGMVLLHRKTWRCYGTAKRCVAWGARFMVFLALPYGSLHFYVEADA